MIEDSRILNYLYEILHNNLMQEKALKNNSVFLSLISMKSHKRLEYLKNASRPLDELGGDIEELLELGYLRMIERLNNYCLSGLGIWTVERGRGLINPRQLVDFLDKENFRVEIKPLSPREKVVLFSFISLRSFYEGSLVDMRNKYVHDHIGEVLEKSLDFLKEMEIVNRSYSKEKFYGNPGNETPMINVLRHGGDSLANKTLNTFKAAGNQRYYLDLFDDQNGLDVSKLKILFEQIFGGANLFERRRELITFLIDVPREYGLYFFDKDAYIFLDDRFDFLIEETVEECLLD